jgi:hypothetical protein
MSEGPCVGENVQVLDVDPAQYPVHWSKVSPESGVAVSVSDWPAMTRRRPVFRSE